MAIKKQRLRRRTADGGYDIVHLETEAGLVEGLEAEFTSHAYSHPSYTACTGVPAANATPGFGGTFTVTQPVSDSAGHITAMNSRTITIPSGTASTSANGLMSKDHVASLNAKQDKKITDDSNGKKYQFGFNNGALYYKEVS